MKQLGHNIVSHNCKNLRSYTFSVKKTNSADLVRTAEKCQPRTLSLTLSSLCFTIRIDTSAKKIIPLINHFFSLNSHTGIYNCWDFCVLNSLKCITLMNGLNNKNSKYSAPKKFNQSFYRWGRPVDLYLGREAEQQREGVGESARIFDEIKNTNACMILNLKVTRRDLGSISSTFYKQLLDMQILKVQKDSQAVSFFLPIWDLCS